MSIPQIVIISLVIKQTDTTSVHFSNLSFNYSKFTFALAFWDLKEREENTNNGSLAFHREA